MGYYDFDEPKVTYLGPKASYTHQAALEIFNSPQFTLNPCTSIDDVFTAVQDRQSSFGVVPFENSTNGAVVFTLDLFKDHFSKHPDIIVCGEVYIPVHHCLLGRKAQSQTISKSDATQYLKQYTPAKTAASQLIKPTNNDDSGSGAATPIPGAPFPKAPRTKPLTSINHLTTIHTHPQAWGQCKTFMSAYLKPFEKLDESSTSKAALVVRDDDTGTHAAICSELAATIYGLDVLAREIEDEPDNMTRFFVIQHKDATEEQKEDEEEDMLRLAQLKLSSRKQQQQDKSSTKPQSVGLSFAQAKAFSKGKDKATTKSSPSTEESPKKYKTLVTFTPAEHPGALADALAVFKKYGINLASINTRPSGLAKWEYLFFVEFEGRTGEEQVEGALRELAAGVTTLRCLGSFESEVRGRGGGVKGG